MRSPTDPPNAVEAIPPPSSVSDGKSLKLTHGVANFPHHLLSLDPVDKLFGHIAITQVSAHLEICVPEKGPYARVEIIPRVRSWKIGAGVSI